MALLDIRELRKTFPTGETALKGIDISVNAKEVVAILGISGSGKSTLLRCINRLVEPDSGAVVLDGVDLTRLGKRELRSARRHIGMIFQDYKLLEESGVKIERLDKKKIQYWAKSLINQ